jgi:hypothetical protein
MPVTFKWMNLIGFVAKTSVPGILRKLLNKHRNVIIQTYPVKTMQLPPGGAMD